MFDIKAKNQNQTTSICVILDDSLLIETTVLKAFFGRRQFPLDSPNCREYRAQKRLHIVRQPNKPKFDFQFDFLITRLILLINTSHRARLVCSCRWDQSAHHSTLSVNCLLRIYIYIYISRD